MQEVLEVLGPEITPLIVNLLMSIVSIVFALIGYQVNKLVKKYKDHEDVKAVRDALKRNQELARLSVEYAEKIGENIGIKGEEKFNLAKTKFIEVLGDKGIEISDTEIDLLIEQGVMAFNKGYKHDADTVVVEDNIEEKQIEELK